jgi:hypothetical protein
MSTRTLLLSSLILAASLAQGIQPIQPGTGAAATKLTEARTAQGTASQSVNPAKVRAGEPAAQASQVAVAASSATDAYNLSLTEVVIDWDGSALVGVSAPPANTCDYWGLQFRFDPTTAKGKNLLALLLQASSMGKNIGVGFDNSTAPGTNGNNGCSLSTMATLEVVRVVY